MDNDIKRLERRALLYDFYGPLLTDHQRKIYEEVVIDDYSITEVAQDEGISRQGVHDMIRRCDKALEEYEERLGLAEKFRRIETKVREIKEVCSEDKEEGFSHITGLADDILEIL